MNNPFNKLKVQRDEEDNETLKTNAPTTNKNQPLFNNTKNEEKKKVKQRPPKEEKPSHDDNEGFEYVGKVPKKSQKLQSQNAEYVSSNAKPGAKDTFTNEKTYHKRGDKYDNNYKPRGNKREFERHSGTGRGNEVKKGGAGGKGTWGVQNNKRDIVDYDDTEYYFNKALNPSTIQEEGNLDEETKENKEEVNNNDEKKNEGNEIDKEENKNEEATNDKDGKKKPKKGDKNVQEVDEKDKLIIPKNAITLSELRKKQQQENKDNTNKKEVDIKNANNVNLEVISSKKDNSSNAKIVNKKGNKVKNSKFDPKEIEANKYLGNLTVEEYSKPSYNKDRNYDNKKNKNKGIKMNDQEFPSLK